jgi:hypothetical protein
LSVLENRYRRLLRSYPVDHRRVHEEEMLGVLLADAGPEQTRPSVRDALDLVRGGLGIRIRRTPSALAEAGWRDGAALLSVIAPLILLAEAVRYATEASDLVPLSWRRPPYDRGRGAGRDRRSRTLGAELGVNWGDRRVFVVIAALLAGGWLARTAAGRRAIVVLVAPLYAIVAPFNPGYIEDPLARILITMVVIPVSIGVAALAVVTVLEWLVVRPLADRDRAVG